MSDFDSKVLPVSPNLPEIENIILDRWKEKKTFERSVEKRQDEENFVFYDGPPFANGLPHYGHLLTGFAKDAVARYQTQRGKHVSRVFGWDTHGLPAELEAMRQMGMKNKSEIDNVGINVFNDYCREGVMKYSSEWKDYVTRQARWVDFDNGYKTMDTSYMESVLWAFKNLYDKGLVYESHRVLPYCWKDETPLSNHELSMDDDVYRERNDVAVTVKFKMVNRQEVVDDDMVSHSMDGVFALAWTTTPWTLPTNMALAVNPNVKYVVVSSGGEKYLLSENALQQYFNDTDKKYEMLFSFNGDNLKGLKYSPVFDYYPKTDHVSNKDSCWRFLVDDYVTDDNGNGVVHMSPAYGDDDYRVCVENNVDVVLSVNDSGEFLQCFSDDPVLHEVAGLQVFEANDYLVSLLEKSNLLFEKSDYQHSYPHCWRCKTPLIYRAVSSWYVKVTDVKDEMLNENQKITWYPSHVKDGQFGTWLSNARDWSVSRNRYWGTPIPVWVSDDPDYPHVEVYGSLKDLSDSFGRLPVNNNGDVDLHRPWIDDLVKPHPDPVAASKGVMLRRVTDVLDVWFDSGSMPFAQMHYPFENKEFFEKNSPADFIVEYVGQTRGWFYTLHALSVALFGRRAFDSAVSHGIILGSDGKKMSKSLRNYPDVNLMMDSHGADAMRWFLFSSPILSGGNLSVNAEGVAESVREAILPMWNAYRFYNLYKMENFLPDSYNEVVKECSHVSDVHMLTELNRFTRVMRNYYDTYRFDDACKETVKFFDTVNNWFLRLNRHRFFNEERDCFNVLYHVLDQSLRSIAPMLPMFTEYLWTELTGKDSVHLEDFPESYENLEENETLVMMERTRSLVSVVSSLRKRNNIRLRVPLPYVTVTKELWDMLSPDHRDIVLKETNVEKIMFFKGDEGAVNNTTYSLNFRMAGSRYGKLVPLLKKALSEGSVVYQKDGSLAVNVNDENIVLSSDMFTRDVTVTSSKDDCDIVITEGLGAVELNLVVTEENAVKGIVRDTIRSIQNARKKKDFNVSDRVSTTVYAPTNIVNALSDYKEHMMSETLSSEMLFMVDDSYEDVSIFSDVSNVLKVDVVIPDNNE